MPTEIRAPQFGESVTEAQVGRWLKNVGDAVEADEPLVELETDKASLEVPAPAAGVLSDISAKEGDAVEAGALLGAIGDAANAEAEPEQQSNLRKEKPADPKEKKKSKADASPTKGKSPARSASKPAPTSVDGGGIEIRVPQAGESVTEAQIGEWLKKEGEAVVADEPIVRLETDKAAMDVAAPTSGVLKEIAAKEGATVEVGALLAVIEPGGEASARGEDEASAAIEDGDEVSAAGEEEASVADQGEGNVIPLTPSNRPSPREIASAGESVMESAGKPISPAPRRIIDEKGLDPASIKGTGKGGRITKADALAAKEAKKKPAEQPRETGEREERVAMTRLRQTIARRLKEAQNEAAILTTFNDVDMRAVIDMRAEYKELFEKKHGVKLGFMSFFVKACVHALKEVPDVNAEIDGTDIVYKNHYDIGVAVGTDKGLVVPVLKDADKKSLADIEAEIAELSRRAREGALKLEEMQGGTFTISNGGVYGSLLSTPILNPPQSGILGMHRIEERAVVREGAVVVRPMMYLALSYDHRVVDGKGAVTFLVRVKENIEDPQRLMLDL